MKLHIQISHILAYRIVYPQQYRFVDRCVRPSERDQWLSPRIRLSTFSTSSKVIESLKSLEYVKQDG